MNYDGKNKLRSLYKLANLLGMGLKPANHETLAKERDYQPRKNE